MFDKRKPTEYICPVIHLGQFLEKKLGTQVATAFVQGVWVFFCEEWTNSSGHTQCKPRTHTHTQIDNSQTWK